MTFWKIATSALLALTWSFPAFATHDDRREGRSGRSDHVDIRIERLANGLEESARHIDRRMRDARHSHRGYSGGRDERRAAKAVHELKDASKRFRKHVEKNRSLSHLRTDFDRVAHAYRTAVYRVQRAHLSRHLERDLRAVGHWVDKIDDRHREWNHHARNRTGDERDRNHRTGHRDRVGHRDNYAQTNYATTNYAKTQEATQGWRRIRIQPSRKAPA